MADDPIRLRSMVARGSLLERGLEAAQASGPTDEQLRALERSVLAGLGTAAGAAVVIAKTAESHASGAATGWLSVGATKLVLALVATAAIGGGTVVAWHAAGKRSHGQPAVATPLRVSASSSEGNLRPDLPTPTETSATESEMPSAAPSQPPVAAAFKKHEAPRVGSSKASRGGEDEEVALLERANRALAKSPALALTLAEEHARRFPSSGMDQEREVIAITALVDMGRRSEAQRRAGRFYRAHAGSVYQARIDDALAPHPSFTGR